MPRVPPVTTATRAMNSSPLCCSSELKDVHGKGPRCLPWPFIFSIAVSQAGLTYGDKPGHDTDEFLLALGNYRSTHIAMPMPPPMQSVARPFLASRLPISNSSVVSTRAPDAPIGWPSAIAPPFTLTFEVSQPRSLLTAQACAANASFASIRSRSPMFQPAFLSAAREAGIGPVPMIAGSTPAGAQDTIRASGVLPRLAASLAVISTTAAAPSLIPDALAAVTVPSLLNAGRSLPIPSSVVPCLG